MVWLGVLPLFSVVKVLNSGKTKEAQIRGYCRNMLEWFGALMVSSFTVSYLGRT